MHSFLAALLMPLVLLLGSGAAGAAQGPWVCGAADLDRSVPQRFVSNQGRDSDDCGATPEQACRTIGQGIQACVPQQQQHGGCAVLVAYGEYVLAEPVRLRAGIDLFGACVVKSRAAWARPTLVQGPAGQPAIVSDANEPGGWKTVQGFKILGGDAPGNGGDAAVAMLIVDPTVVLDSHIVAGRGASGKPGAAPASSAKGGDGSGSAGGANPACRFAQGGNGGSGTSVSVHVRAFSYQCNPSCSPNDCRGSNGGYGHAGGGEGGAPGGSNCAECPVRNAGNGNAGRGGGHAACGVGGRPSPSVTGGLENRRWIAALAGGGDTGLVGGGGGGGGGGGYFGGSCFWSRTERRGGDGGGGGAGGCGGTGGDGGQQGGASIAMLVSGGPLRIEGSRVIGGQGGAGGAGGTGAAGGAPGKPGGGAAGGSGAGTGGLGGSGGAGGAGGGGAGGNGGPSIGIASTAGSRIDTKDLVFYRGVPGQPGAPGPGGAAVIPGVCKGADGESGLAGFATDHLEF